jgi:hypothetical protein
MIHNTMNVTDATRTLDSLAEALSDYFEHDFLIYRPSPAHQVDVEIAREFGFVSRSTFDIYLNENRGRQRPG